MTKLASPLKWHGGKHYLAKRIVELMPPHLHYVEPYFGGGSVLFAKDPDGISEVVNDIDSNLFNFFGVLADRWLFDEFYRRISLVPFSEQAWEESAEECDWLCPEVENAARFFVRCRQSRAGGMREFATLSRNRVRRGMNEQASAWLAALDGLPDVAQRLQRVVILNRDALHVIKQQDGPRTLFYLDPPYLHDTRQSTAAYAHEMIDDDHADMLAVVGCVEGSVILSGYRSKLYDQRLGEWNRHDFEMPNNVAGGKSKRRMVESVWCNF